MPGTKQVKVKEEKARKKAPEVKGRAGAARGAAKKAPARGAAKTAARKAAPAKKGAVKGVQAKTRRGAAQKVAQKKEAAPRRRSFKWINSPEEREDRPGQTLATRNHEVIMQWARDRNAAPATIEGTGPEDRVGVLRFDFPGFGGGRKLKHITWEEWFRPFDERNLKFLYQEHMRAGNQSNFFRIENPTREDA